jgi:transcriptional regulator of heat shock response
MANLTKRNIDILKIIVDEYIETWVVLWSKLLLKKYDLWVSSATVRNDMATLESLELVYQPYNSAWRLPTAKWIRAFVNYLMQQTPDYFLQSPSLSTSKNKIDNIIDFTHKITYELWKNTGEIAFFIVPEKHINEYSWIADFLEKNHKKIWNPIFSIVKILEDKFSFQNFIQNLHINSWVNVFIWEENILPFFKDYSIILKQVMIDWNIWYIWLIWCLQMNYSFNISAVKGII